MNGREEDALGVASCFNVRQRSLKDVHPSIKEKGNHKYMCLYTSWPSASIRARIA